MADVKARQEMMIVVRKRLLLFVGISTVVITVFFGISLFGKESKFYTSWLVFLCGLIGGFVSIQQRLPGIEDDELFLLSKNWTSVLLIPVYGGIFALVLYVLFLSGMIDNDLFPSFYMPIFNLPVEAKDIAEFLRNCYPLSGHDLAKLIFWSFVAGFSERFVPQIIQKVSLKPPPK